MALLVKQKKRLIGLKVIRLYPLLPPPHLFSSSPDSKPNLSTFVPPCPPFYQGTSGLEFNIRLFSKYG